MLSKKTIKEKLPSFLTLIGDLICCYLVVNTIYAPTHHIFFNNPAFQINFIPVKIWIPIAFVLIFAFFGSYRSYLADFGRISIKKPALILFLLYVIIMILLLYNVLYTHSYNNPRYLLRLSAAMIFLASLMGFMRFGIELLYTYLLKKDVISHRILLIFQEVPEKPNLKKIKRYINLNSYTLVGYCGHTFPQKDDDFDIKNLGTFKDTPEIINNEAIDEVIILNYSKDKKMSQKIIGKMENLSILVRIVPGTFETLTGQLSMRSLSENPVISIHPRKMSLSYSFIKRFLDIFISFFGLIFTGLTYPFFAYFIKKSSSGKVIFKQIRLGEKNKPFMLYKYRTMYIDAEKEGPQLAKEDDERITPFGRVLRRNHLDELPQFWNIFKGDMSLVGPRPERAHYAKILSREVPYYQYINRKKPGLTSLGMVKYGYAHTVEEMEERLIYDTIYINNASFLTDIQILIYTILYIVKKMFTRIG